MKKLVPLGIVLALCWITCSPKKEGSNPVAGPGSTDASGGLFYYPSQIYVNDTFHFQLDLPNSGDVDGIRWVLNNSGTVISTEDHFSYTNTDMADTGGIWINGLVLYQDGSTDTHRVFLHIISARPEIFLSLEPPAQADSLFIGTRCALRCSTIDENGLIKTIAWDLDNDSIADGSLLPSDSMAVMTVPLAFSAAGPETLTVWAMDDDSLDSRKSLVLNVREHRASDTLNVVLDTMIYIMDSLIFRLDPDTQESISAMAWVLAPHDTLSKTASFSFAPQADTAQKAIFGYYTYKSGRADTHIVIVGVSPGAPAIHVFALHPIVDERWIDSTYFAYADAFDSNGLVKALLWDLNQDGAFEETLRVSMQNAVDSQPVVFLAPGNYWISVRAMDDHNILSPVRTLSCSVGVAHYDTLIYLGDTVQLPDPQSYNWIRWPSREALSGGVCTYPYVSDTGFQAVLGFGTDTVRTIFYVKSGFPRIDSVTFEGLSEPPFYDSALVEARVRADSAFSIYAHASDTNGTIQYFLWDMDFDYTFDDTTDVSAKACNACTDTLSLLYSTPGTTVTLLLRVTDNDNREQTTRINIVVLTE